MKLDKISASLRRKNLATSINKVHGFIRRNNQQGVYELVIEIYDNRTGERFEMIGSKDEWVKHTGDMMEAFAKQTAGIP